MRTSALSDDQVIQTVNEFFIPVEINVTRDGFPKQLPAMKIVEGVYNSNYRNEFGFASCLVLDPEGKFILGTSAFTKDIKDKIETQILFSPKHFMQFIVISLERFKKLQSIQQMPLMQKINAWKELLVDIGSDITRQIQNMAMLRSQLQ